MGSFQRIAGAVVFGARARLVDVQVSIRRAEGDGSKRGFRIVGLPDSALREGRERIRGAVIHGGWFWPVGMVTVNLAPATARKQGAALDLAIALCVLGAEGSLGRDADLGGWLCLGELGLDGSVRPVRGTLAAAEAARHAGLSRAIVPKGNASEASVVEGLEIVAVSTLEDAVGHLSGSRPLAAEPRRPWVSEPPTDDTAGPLRGQPVALRAAVLAAVGGHNLLLWGPPGAGKTLLARHLVGLLAPLEYEEALDVSRVHSVAGLLGDGGLVTRRPFRAPHHTTSLAGMVGGGSLLRPGELSLAHRGVLFLDELAEFPRAVLESLRQPLEDGCLVLGRASGRATFPADVMLVAATNPCPCGWNGNQERCECSRSAVTRYRARISGPLRDRFDLHVRVNAVDPADLMLGHGTEIPRGIGPKERAAARKSQIRRAKRFHLGRPFNARIPPRLLPAAVQPTEKAQQLLVSRARALGLTGRGVHRCLRVARTVADLEGAERLDDRHVLEALGHRGW